MELKMMQRQNQKRRWTREAVRHMYRDCIQDLGLHPASQSGEDPIFDAKICLSDNVSLQALVNFARRIAPIAIAAVNELQRRKRASGKALTCYAKRITLGQSAEAGRKRQVRLKARLLWEREVRQELRKEILSQHGIPFMEVKDAAPTKS